MCSHIYKIHMENEALLHILRSHDLMGHISIYTCVHVLLVHERKVALNGNHCFFIKWSLLRSIIDLLLISWHSPHWCLKQFPKNKHQYRGSSSMVTWWIYLISQIYLEWWPHMTMLPLESSFVLIYFLTSSLEVKQSSRVPKPLLMISKRKLRGNLKYNGENEQIPFFFYL